MGMYDRTGKTVVRREYTWTEFLDVVEANMEFLDDRHKEGSEWCSGRDKAQWLGDGSITDTLKFARGEGYRAAIVDAEKLAAVIEMDLGESIQNDFVSMFDVAGAEVDMGRYMSGEPECMRESVPMKVMRTGRVIKIAVPVCYPSSIDADVVKQRGAAVMALVNAFAMLQHPVEIYATLGIHGGSDKRLAYAIKVQDADQPLNMGRVMYALAHPTMLRQLLFASEHQEEERWRREFNIGHGYGHPGYHAVIDDLNINVENCIILPPLMSNHGWDEASSVEWIKEQIKMITEGAR